MRIVCFAAVAAAAFLGGASAFAQGGAVITAEPMAREVIELPADQEVIVREYVTRLPAQPVIIEGGGTVRPGSVVPEFVPLQPMGEVSVPGLRRFAYFISPDNKIVIVDPATRVVARILSP